jgi:hypothetical protein
VGFVGRDSPVKNVPLFCTIAERLMEEVPSLHGNTTCPPSAPIENAVHGPWVTAGPFGVNCAVPNGTERPGPSGSVILSAPIAMQSEGPDRSQTEQ